MFPLHQIAHVGVSQSRGLKLFGRNYFRRIPTYVITVPDRYRRTDRQTKAILIPRYALVHCAVKIAYFLPHSHSAPLHPMFPFEFCGVS